MNTSQQAGRPGAGRMPMIDVLKGASCLLIVGHHLAFYGPMSDIALPLAPTLMAWLYDYGRMAVQVFLVVSGFLAASSLAPLGTAVFDQPMRQILRRYARLAMPYLLALTVSVAVAALVRPWMQHASVPDDPTWWQLLSHVLLLQGVAGQESLSAGVWYVAIDFQLFALAVVVLVLARSAQKRLPASRLTRTSVLAPCGMVLVAGLTVASLMYFNRHPELDNTALYFFGAYGLGMLTFWAGRSRHSRYWLAALLVLGVVALATHFRARIATALVVALWLGVVQVWPRLQQWPRSSWLQTTGKMSYSVFLIHFPVCLLVNAVVSQLWPTQPVMNLLGMALAFGLSLAAGAALYRHVESRPLSVRKLVGVQASLMVVGLVA